MEGQVVEEEQRAGALHRNIVDAVVDDVHAESVVTTEHRGDLHFGANPIGRRHQHRVDHLRRRFEPEHATKGAHVRQHRRASRSGQYFTQMRRRLAGVVEVDTNVGVGRHPLAPRHLYGIDENR
jgi:hypothetical protein